MNIAEETLSTNVNTGLSAVYRRSSSDACGNSRTVYAVKVEHRRKRPSFVFLIHNLFFISMTVLVFLSLYVKKLLLMLHFMSNGSKEIIKDI